ncbi:MAG TPA: hypothetical protein VMY76_14065 [Gemmatimonadales bacterium]|nr:hypothetical protein [Gemmatimonadales bacterium]
MRKNFVVRSLPLLLPGLLGCEAPAKREPPPAPEITRPTEDAVGKAALAAVAAAPWDSDPTGGEPLCRTEAPCDTVVIEPRVVVLPGQPPAFFVPDKRDLAATLSAYALTLTRVPGRQTVLGSWRECSSRRDVPGWSRGRVACVALGVAGFETARADAMTFALLVATPARGLSWPRVRVTRPRESWRGRLLSNGGR